VHFPSAFISKRAFVIFLPSQGLKGSRSCNLSELSFTTTLMSEPSSTGSK